MLKFFGKAYPLKARVVSVGGLSAHGDQQEMLRFLKESNLSVNRIALVHGEEDQTLAFAEYLKGKGYAVSVPRVGETLPVR